MRLVTLDRAQLEVEDRGTGEPVVLIPTALTPDQLLPLADHPALRTYRVIHYHRRGYGRSSPVHGSGSIYQDAADCEALLTALEVDRAHVVGVSYSAAVALQLAADRPRRVHTLTLVEPPPRHVPSAEQFIAVNRELLQHYRNYGALSALGLFFTSAMGPDWKARLERHLAGGVAEVERDADTFFASDIPALLNWEFDEESASAISHPVLYMGGHDSGAWFAEVRDLVLAWLPHTEVTMVTGADHFVALTHPGAVADALAAFIGRHPMA